MRVGPSTVAHHNPHAHQVAPREEVHHETTQEVPPATQAEAGTSTGQEQAGAETTESSGSGKHQKLFEKLASGHFNDVAAMRLRLNHAEELEQAGVQLPPVPEESTHPGRGFQKALDAYRAAFPPPVVQETETEQTEPEPVHVEAGLDILPLDPPEPGGTPVVDTGDATLDVLPLDTNPDANDENEPVSGAADDGASLGAELADDLFEDAGAA